MARIDNVQFKYMGQNNFQGKYDPRYPIAFSSIGDGSGSHTIKFGKNPPVWVESIDESANHVSARPSYVISSTFFWSYSPAIGAFDCQGITIRNNVVYRSVDSGKYSASISRTTLYQ